MTDIEPANLLTDNSAALGLFSLDGLDRAFAQSSFTQSEFVERIIQDFRSPSPKVRLGAAKFLWLMARDVATLNGRLATGRRTKEITDAEGNRVKVSITSFSILDRLRAPNPIAPTGRVLPVNTDHELPSPIPDPALESPPLPEGD